MGKILLFYKYIDIEKPQEIAVWQRELCQSLNLKGRILIAHEGINGTLGGCVESINGYKQAMLEHHLFADIDIKESSGNACHFPRLKVQVKKEIVRLNFDGPEASYKNGGIHVSPEQAHRFMQEQSEDFVFLDGRNNYESAIGTFAKAITPNINNFREFPSYVDAHLEQFKDKQVLMFCTGGIRCERASAYLKSKGVAKEVYQITGGIHRYIEKFPDGFFKGKNYVFDGRIAIKVTSHTLATCYSCAGSYDDYSNCINAECNKQIIVCQACSIDYHNTCSESCAALVKEQKVTIRTKPTRTPDNFDN